VHPSSRRLPATLLLAALVLLAGCAGGFPGGSDGSAVEPTNESPPVASDEPTTATTNGTLEVHFINVRQSVSTLIISPSGETMLVDTGHYRDDGTHVLAYLQRHDIERIDHLVTSHADADHIGGHAAVIDYYETEADGIGTVYDPGIAASTQTYGAYLDAVAAHNVTLYETRAGDAIAFAGVDVAVLGPPEPYLDGNDRNENSLVLQLTYGETSLVLTGDAEADQEGYLVSTYGERLNATILKTGHHGSASSSTPAFLDVTRPQIAVISSAYDSQYGHPHEEVLERLGDRSIPTYWTATHGDVVFTSDGQRVAVATQRNVTTAPTALRDAEPVSVGSTDAVATRDQFTVTETLSVSAGASEEPDDPTRSSTPETTGGIAIVEIQADAPGDDRSNLNGEYLVIANTGDKPRDLSGYQVRDAAGKTYTIPGDVTLAPGDSLTLRTGSGTDTTEMLYWNASGPVWNNDGDTVTVITSDGEPVVEESYS